MSTPASAATQNDSMLRNGNAMVPAPDNQRKQEVPEAARKDRHNQEKVIDGGVNVDRHVLWRGPENPPVSRENPPQSGTGVSGHASSQRTTSASRPPRIIIKSPRNRNCRAIILWSVEKT